METKNVIVLMFDSLQYNYLRCNGNDWIKTPNFDRFAREGVVFDNCYIEGVPTIPCRRAMHTGRYTLPYKGWTSLDMEDTTIADMCWGKPIDTALVFDCPMYRLPKFGYTRGFDKVWFIHGHEGDHDFYSKDELIHLNPLDFHEQNVLDNTDRVTGNIVVEPLLNETTCYLKQRQYWKTEEDQNVVKVMKSAVDYLEKVDRNKPFYLWVDNFDPHEPWDPPSVYDPEMKCPYNPDYKGKDQFLPVMGPVEGIYSEEELHHIRMLYAEKVSMCDRWLGYFMDNVKRLALDKDTLILLVSDHGEPMGNGEHGHGIMRKCRPWPYEELVHGVMMMRGPGIPANTRKDAFVQSCDVAPTVCDWLGIGVQSFHQGKSLIPLAKGEVDKVRDFAIAGYHRFSWSIITHDWSYIHWVRKDDATVGEAMYEIYHKGIINNVGHLTGGAMRNAGPIMSDEQRKLKQAAALDGEDQWTCTPGSVAEVPANDELYDRKKDIYQLNNVASQHPAVAKELFDKLREFMGELITC